MRLPGYHVLEETPSRFPRVARPGGPSIAGDFRDEFAHRRSGTISRIEINRDKSPRFLVSEIRDLGTYTEPKEESQRRAAQIAR